MTAIRTVRLEAWILKDVEALMHREGYRSFSAFVTALIEDELQRRHMATAALSEKFRKDYEVAVPITPEVLDYAWEHEWNIAPDSVNDMAYISSKHCNELIRHGLVKPSETN